METIKRDVAKIVSVSAVHQLGVSLLFAVYTVYLLGNGLSLFQAALVNVSYHIAVPLLEIPTGAISDTWGRKKALMVSSLIWVVGSVIYGAGNHFALFVLAEITVAVATAFGSGCFSAHIWDVVSDHGSRLGLTKKRVAELNGRFVSTHRVVLGVVSAVGGLVGAWLFEISPALPWYVSALVYVGAFFATKRLLEEGSSRVISGAFAARVKVALKKTKLAMQAGIRVRSIRRMAIINMIGAIAAAPLFMFWQPRLLELSSATFLGYAWVLIQGAVVAGKFVGGKINGRGTSYRLISASFVLSGVAALLAAVSQSIVMVVVWFLTFEAALGLNAYAIEVKNNHDITESGHGGEGVENKRATLISLNSMAKGVGSSVGLLVGGALAQILSISGAWVFGSIAMIVLSLTTFLWTKVSD